MKNIAAIQKCNSRETVLRRRVVKGKLFKAENHFLKQLAKPGLIFVYFRSFHIPIQLKNIQFELCKFK